MSDPKKAILARFDELVNEYNKVNKAMEEKKKEKEKLLESLQDCVAAGRLFGFNIWDESSLSSTESQSTKDSLSIKKDKHRTVRDFVIAAAKAAHPQPVRAKKLHDDLEAERGEKVHPKTIGMTLYRLAQDKIVKREKYDWFYILEENRNDPFG